MKNTEKIDKLYNYYWGIPSDINEHFPTIKKYASECETIYELGVRAIVSTWALLAGYPKKMVSVDIIEPSFYGGSLDLVKTACSEAEIDFAFSLASSTGIKLSADLLFIDTLHTYEQLKEELFMHGKDVKKYIILHDTESAGEFSVDSVGNEVGGLTYAIEEFLNSFPEWKVEAVHMNNNGLTILKRV